MSTCLSCSNRYILLNTANRNFTYPLVPGVPKMGTAIKKSTQKITKYYFKCHPDMSFCIENNIILQNLSKKQKSGANGLICIFTVCCLVVATGYEEHRHYKSAGLLVHV